MRIVVKIGTSTLTHQTGMLNIRRAENLVKVLSDLKNFGHELILVSSGSIGMGVGKLMLSGRPDDMPTKQAASAVGQVELMYTYDKLFNQFNHNVAQILLTSEDIHNEKRSINIKNSISRLLELKAIPIINENDAVSTDEIGVETTIGENDTLSAIVSSLLQADILIILSDIDGLYTSNPHEDKNAKLIPVVEEVTPEIMALAHGKGSNLSSGGMTTKLKAAEIVNKTGCDMVIINGNNPELLYDVIEGKPAGTKFLGRKN
jgi:glutamate 5-kinase